MIRLDFLEKTEVFKGLNQDQLAAVRDCCEEVEFNRGDKIFGEGDTAEKLFAVINGQVDLRFDLPKRSSSEENTISSLSEGQAFGWSSLVPPHKYTLSAYCANETCKLIKADKASLAQLLKKDDEVGYRVMSNIVILIGKRFHKLQDRVTKDRGLIL
jgi:CRP-like cAMP-binding protein